MGNDTRLRGHQCSTILSTTMAPKDGFQRYVFKKQRCPKHAEEDVPTLSLNCRHASFVPSPETEGLNRYLLTLLAQRRELCSESLKTQLHGEASHDRSTGTSGAVFHGANISSAAIDAERRDLQAELTLGLESARHVPVTDRLRQALTSAGCPLKGVLAGCFEWGYFLSRRRIKSII